MLCCLCSLFGLGQARFGNEWIRPGQPYLKLSVNKAGIYRLGYQDIRAADASLLTTNPTNWQLFFRGQEVAMRVVGQPDGVFNEQDYIEFYGEGNDGSQDSLLYRPQKRLHPYQTLFSDVAAYFLTVSPTQPGKRMEQPSASAQGLTPERFHVEETVQAFTNEYTFNNLKGLEPLLQQSYFEPGEGWSGKLLTADSVGVVQLSFTNPVAADWPIDLEGMINGRDPLSHRIQVLLDAPTQTALPRFDFFGFDSRTFRTALQPSVLQTPQLMLRFRPEKGGGPNQFSITYVKLSYPQGFDMAGQSTKVFRLPASTRQTALLAIPNAPTGAAVYDITDKANCRFLSPQARDGQVQVVVPQAALGRTVLLTNQLLKPLAVQSVRFRTIFPASTNYLILTHASLLPSATAFADYRASAAGGAHRPLIVQTDSLFDQFNYGERSPLALRRFADYMLANTAVKNLLLLGRACSYPYYVKTAPDDLVPTIGYPGSDILLTAGLAGTSANTPAIPTGRLNVTTNEQVLAYLAKVKQYETTMLNGLWRKQLVHISGGKTQEEAVSLRNTMTALGNLYASGTLGGPVRAFVKTAPYEKVETINLAPLVNEGVGLITFFGHAGPSITDVNFGFASPLANGFRNQRYPFMIFNGCGVGEIFARFNTLSTDWLLAPDKGAALVLAHSYYSYEEPTTRYLTKLYGDLFANPATLGMPFGKVQQQLNSALEKEGVQPHDVAMLLQMVLQGDPALSLYPLPNPDFSVDRKDLYLRAPVAGRTLKNSDSIRVVVPLANLGRFVAGSPVSLRISTTTRAGVTTYRTRLNPFRYRDTLVYTLPKDETLQQVEVVIDPDNQLAELSKANNTAVLTIDWAQAGAASSYPPNALPDAVSPALAVLINGSVQRNGAVVNAKPRLDIYLTDENPLPANDPAAVAVYIADCETCTLRPVSPQSFTVMPVSANQLRLSTSLQLTEGQTVQLTVFGKDAAGNLTQPPYRLSLNVLGTDESISLRAYPNPAATYARFDLDLNVRQLPTEAKLTIYALTGTLDYEGKFPVVTGRNTLLWEAKTPGLYPYSLQLTWPDGRTETRTGRVVCQF